MDEYAGRVLADRYRLPLPPSDEYELAETRAFDTYSGQEVLVRQVPLPEVVEAEVLDAEGGPAPRRPSGRSTRGPADPAVRRAIEAAQSAAQIPDHPRLDQVFDVFAESGSLWIVSELVAARPLAALLAEEPLNPYRAAEIASDVLTAVRVLHAHGWTHRNITARTVLVCDDGRVVLTGLAVGAAEEALCGYVTAPTPPGPPPQPGIAGQRDGAPAPGISGGQGGPDHLTGPGTPPAPGIQGQPDPYGQLGPGVPAGPAGPGDRQPPAGHDDAGDQPSVPVPGVPYGPGLPYGTGAAPGATAGLPGSQGRAALESGRGAGGQDSPYAIPYRDDSSGTSGAMPRPPQQSGLPALSGGNASGDIRAARAGAIAAYRAGARAAARVSEDEQNPSAGALPAPRPEPGGDSPAGPPRDTGTDRDWWAQPPGTFDGGGSYADDADDDDDEDDDDPPRPYRVELAGTWRDGPAPWSDGPGSIPAGGGGSGGSGGAGGDGTSGIPRGTGWGTSGQADDDSAGAPDVPEHDGSGAAPGIPALPAGFPAAGDHPGGRPALPPGGSGPSPDGGDGPAHRPGAAMARTGSGDSPYAAPGGGNGGWQSTGANDALRADARRHGPGAGPASRVPATAGRAAGPGRWDEMVASGGSVAVYRGPTTPLAAERARQARIAIVGPVTERWAPEQAGPVHENWQLAPPIGPSTDLWALGALLYRAVQGHAPYPEENAAELVQLVCAEPPAFAEECGALRPVVESLLRQDPTERPDFEELRGWLRSLVRSAPEPEAGADIVALPSVDGRLPIVRRKGELVRRRRRGEMGRHRHKNKKKAKESRARRESDVRESRHAVSPEGRYVGPGAAEFREEEPRQEDDDRTEQFERYEQPGRPEPARARGSRHLGRTLLILVLLLLVAGVVYAVMFLPKAGEQQGASTGDGGPGTSAAPVTPGASAGAPAPPAPPKSGSTAPGSAASSTPQETVPASNLPAGYVLRKDSEGFQVAVPKDWQRRPINDSQQIRYVNGAFQLIVVPGRDSAADMGNDPMKYQLDKEPELAPYRSSSWATSGNLLRIDVGRMATAEGLFTWQDSNGGEIAVRNVAMIINGRYHILQVIGPKGEGDKVKEIFEQAKPSYKVTR